MSRHQNAYDLGFLAMGDKLVNLKSYQGISPSEVRDVINEIKDHELIFVGFNLRSSVLAPLLRDLTRLELNLPEKLKFHWVPPYKMPFEEVSWLYNFGMFDENVGDLDTIAADLGVISNDRIRLLAECYFKLIGDFEVLK